MFPSESNGPLSEFDLHLFHEGTHARLYEKLGAHLQRQGETTGYRFGVWAPGVERVTVMGDFNGWDPQAHPLRGRTEAGWWEGFVPHAPGEAKYKFHVVTRPDERGCDEGDPFAFRHEAAPGRAAVLCDLAYQWNDAAWMRDRGARLGLAAPVSIYQMHLASWRRVPEEGNRLLSYRELAPYLVEHLRRLGCSHVEFLLVLEQEAHACGRLAEAGPACLGYFAPNAQSGAPHDLMYLIDVLHQHGFGVILDWVPSHFAANAPGLARFNGPPSVGPDQPARNTRFNFQRGEVRSLLLSSAFFWFDRYHADGLRVWDLGRLLYRPPSAAGGGSSDSPHPAVENREAVDFLRRLNSDVYAAFPGVQMIAEESTGWPDVSRPTYLGGLGFGYKWDSTWADQTLPYFGTDPLHRKSQHGILTSRNDRASMENLILPLSHQLVAPGRPSLLRQMAGDEWQRFANLRLLFGLMFGQPGKKLFFMSAEFGQWNEWSPEQSLDWHLAAARPHHGVQRWVEDLNQLYRRQPALHQRDCGGAGFEWVDAHDAEHSTLSWLRQGEQDVVLVVCNFTPVLRTNFRLGVPRPGTWREALNSDSLEYGGSGQGNFGGLEAAPFEWHGRPFTLALTLPPLATLFFTHQ